MYKVLTLSNKLPITFLSAYSSSHAGSPHDCNPMLDPPLAPTDVSLYHYHLHLDGLFDCSPQRTLMGLSRDERPVRGL